MNDETTNDEALNEAVSRRRLLERAAFAGAGIVAGAAAVAMSGNAAAQIIPGGEKASLFTSRDAPFSVRRSGAKGDGKTDDTDAVQEAIDAAIKAGGGRVHFPSGTYRITRTLHVGSVARIDITGDGWSSTLLHENDVPLLLWPEGVECRECSVRHLQVAAVGKIKSPGTPIIACMGGMERSFFQHLMFDGGESGAGSGIVSRNVADTTTLDHCLMWRVSGVGLEIAKGSEVRVFGARIIGVNTQKKENIGVLLTGNNGGVHLVTTDIIAVHTGMQIGGVGGENNREIIVTHATFDSCVYGLRQFDAAYTSIAGCWAASSDESQIQTEPSARGALLSISGGTIFNGGAYNRPGSKNGLVVRAGSFNLTGVNVRHNQGVGILVEGEGVGNYTISGCHIFNNGTGAIFRSGRRAITGNIFTGNTAADLVDTTRGDNPFTGNLLGA